MHENDEWWPMPQTTETIRLTVERNALYEQAFRLRVNLPKEPEFQHCPEWDEHGWLTVDLIGPQWCAIHEVAEALGVADQDVVRGLIATLMTE